MMLKRLSVRSEKPRLVAISISDRNGTKTTSSSRPTVLGLPNLRDCERLKSYLRHQFVDVIYQRELRATEQRAQKPYQLSEDKFRRKLLHAESSAGQRRSSHEDRERDSRGHARMPMKLFPNLNLTIITILLPPQPNPCQIRTKILRKIHECGKRPRARLALHVLQEF